MIDAREPASGWQARFARTSTVAVGKVENAHRGGQVAMPIVPAN